MGFFDKAKQFLNIGGVKVELLGVGPDISRAEKSFSGKIRLTSKSEQTVKSVKVVFERKITKYNVNLTANTNQGVQISPQNQNMNVREDKLGFFNYQEPFNLKHGEEKIIDFSVNYNLPNNVSATGGANISINLGGVTKQEEKEEYFVSVSADVDKAAVNANQILNVRVV